MPRYEYRCACGNEEERFSSMAESKNQDCTECGERLELLISMPGQPVMVQQYGALIGRADTPTDQLMEVPGHWGQEAPLKNGPRQRIKIDGSE